MISEELALRMGLNTSGFEGGLKRALDSTREFHHEWRGLKTLFEVGGLTVAVERFFNMAIEQAKKAKDQEDEHVKAVLEFGDGLEYVGGQLRDFSVFFLGTWNKLGAAIGDVISIARTGWSDWADQQDKLAETSKDLADTLARIAAQKGNAAEYAQITKDISAELKKQAEMRLEGYSDEEKLNILMTERQSLEYILSHAQLDTLTRREAERSLAQETTQILKLQGQQTLKDKADELKYEQQGEQLDKELKQLAFDKLTPAQQLVALEKQRADLVLQMVASATDENTVKQLEIDLAKNQNEIDAKNLEIQKQKTAELQKQAAAAAEAAKIAAGQAQADAMNTAARASFDNYGKNATSTTYQFDGMTIGPAHDPSYFANLSNDVLQKIIDNVNAQIATLEANKYTDPSAGAEAASGFFHRGQAEDQLATEAQRAAYVLQQNKKLSSLSRTDALSQYTGDLGSFDSAYNQAQNKNNPQLTSIGASIDDIAARLGFLPKN